MAKIVKAYCSVAKKYFGLSVEQIGGKWKVVDVMPISTEQGKLVSSEVSQPSFETNSNLLACETCGSRKIGGCRCAKRKTRCATGMKYNFQCAYCENMKIDYSVPDISELGGKVGEKIVLGQGQEVVIRGRDNKPLNRIEVGIGWDPARQGDNIDVDSSVVLLSAQGGSNDLVYFGNLEHPSGCVVHHGDNLTGDDEDQGDDENISVHLNKVPAGRDKIVFVLNVYKCDERRQTLDVIKNLYIRLYDPDSRKALIEYKVGNTSRTDTAIVIGAAYRKSGGWTFKAIGKTLHVSTVSELARICRGYA